MISIKRYTADDKLAWNQFVKGSKNGTFMLLREYIDYHSDRFVDYSLLFYKDSQLIALLPSSIHGVELRSHGGLTYGGMILGYDMKQQTMNDCFEALIQYLKENNIEQLVYKTIPYVYHRYPSQEDQYCLWKNHAKLIRRDVSTTIDLKECKIKLPKGRKAQISRAKREGILVELSTDFATFIALENQVLGKYHQTKAVHTPEELALLYHYFPENIRLYSAIYNNEMVAGVLLFVYENLIHTQYMASSDFARNNGGLDLIIATIIEEYKGTKQYLDFGISTEDNSKYLNNGLISQKESFGGRSVMYDFYELIVN